MKGEQLYYTSCEVGYEQSPGFQVKAISKNFDDNLISEFKQFGSYKPPYNFPSQPTQEEIKQFPIAFRYKKEDNFFLFIKATYLGKDFTAQRYGNYFMHGILLNELESWPIDLYYSNVFKENDYNNDIYLSEIIININEDLIKDKLVNILKEIDKEIVKKMIRALFLSKEQQRPLLIKVNNSKEALNYLTILQKLLPLEIATSISFSSYQFNYNYLTDINITVGETDLAFDSNDFNYNFFIFDLENNKFSDISLSENQEYEKIIDFIDDIEILYKFYTFSKYFSLKKLTDLNFVLKLFLVLDNKIKISNKEILELLNVINYVKEERKEWVITKLLYFVKNLTNLNGNDLSALINFYLVVYEQYQKPIYKKFIIEYLFVLYLETLKKTYNKDDFYQIYKKIINSELEKSFKKYVIQNYKLVLNNCIKTMDNNNILEFFDYISSLKEENLFEILIEILIKKNDFPFEAIKYFKDKNHYILLIIQYIENEQILLNFIEEYYSSFSDEYFKLIKYLSDFQGLEDFLKLEFINRVSKLDNKIEFFNLYIKNIQNKEDFLKLFWKELSLIEKREQIFKWFNSKQLNKIMEMGLKEQIISEINKNISFEIEHNEFDNMLEKFENIELTDEVNKIFLRQNIIKFKENNLPKIKKELHKLYKINPNQYKNYLINLYRNIKIIDLEKLYSETLIDNIEQIVIEIFNGIILENTEITPLDRKLMIFWLEVDKSSFKYKHLQEQIIKIFIKKIVKFNKNEIEQTKDFLIKNLKKESKNKCNEMFEEIEELLIPRYKKYFGKFKNMLDSFTKNKKG